MGKNQFYEEKRIEKLSVSNQEMEKDFQKCEYDREHPPKDPLFSRFAGWVYAKVCEW